MRPLAGVILLAAIVGTVWLFYVSLFGEEQMSPHQLPASPSSMQENSSLNEEATEQSGKSTEDEGVAPKGRPAEAVLPELEAFKGLEEESALIQQPPFTDDLLQNVIQ